MIRLSSRGCGVLWITGQLTEAVVKVRAVRGQPRGQAKGLSMRLYMFCPRLFHGEVAGHPQIHSPNTMLVLS